VNLSKVPDSRIFKSFPSRRKVRVLDWK